MVKMSLQSKLRVFAGEGTHSWTDEKVDKFFKMLSQKIRSPFLDQYKSGVRTYLTQTSPSDEAVKDTMMYFEHSVVAAGVAPMYKFQFQGEREIRFADNNFDSFKHHRNFVMELFDRAYRNLQLNRYDQEVLDQNIRFYKNILESVHNASTYEDEQSALEDAKNLRDDLEQNFSILRELPPIPSPRFSRRSSGNKRSRLYSDKEGKKKRTKLTRSVG